MGKSRFTGNGHIFQNLGEGTWFHSGSMAVRQAVAANVNITYKILFNDAVAMTGGQPVDGQISVPMIARQSLDEGVRRVMVVSDEPEKYRGHKRSFLKRSPSTAAKRWIRCNVNCARFPAAPC
ncbi:hypothetical protein HORIV_67140 [Vreelandella olivaria]|uniref:Uncharacterized protein n=1 Tax=Vreelandella olivaria TaxID=390919 RepID=A0ABN5X4Y4_9GAMM|nr:hypothetical protein HORIV_67140 [Halomonas olivaria]